MKQAHNDYRACKRDVRVVDAVRVAEHVPDHGRWEGHDDPDECATPVADAWSIESQQHENGQRRTDPLSKVSTVANVVRAVCDDHWPEATDQPRALAEQDRPPPLRSLLYKAM